MILCGGMGSRLREETEVAKRSGIAHRQPFQVRWIPEPFTEIGDVEFD